MGRLYVEQQTRAGPVMVDYGYETSDAEDDDGGGSVAPSVDGSVDAARNLECLRHDDDSTAPATADQRIAWLERHAKRLNRDVKTVWTLERAFERRARGVLDGYGDEVRLMRDGVVDELYAGQRSLVAEAIEAPARAVAACASRVAAIDAGAAILAARAAATDGRLAATEAFGARLDALERRAEAAEARADILEAALAARDEADVTKAAKAEDDGLAAVEGLEVLKKRVDAIEQLAAPLAESLTALDDRVAAVLMVDAAADRACGGDLPSGGDPSRRRAFFTRRVALVPSWRRSTSTRARTSSAEYPRRGRGAAATCLLDDPSPKNIHVAAAAPPRLVSERRRRSDFPGSPRRRPPRRAPDGPRLRS